MNEEITRLALELESKTTRLELYEKLEADLDVMILKAAAVPGMLQLFNFSCLILLYSFQFSELFLIFIGDCSGGDLRSMCSFGNGLPTDSKRRLQQAFDLAKR